MAEDGDLERLPFRVQLKKGAEEVLWILVVFPLTTIYWLLKIDANGVCKQTIGEARQYEGEHRCFSTSADGRAIGPVPGGSEGLGIWTRSEPGRSFTPFH